MVFSALQPLWLSREIVATAIFVMFLPFFPSLRFSLSLVFSSLRIRWTSRPLLGARVPRSTRAR